VLDLVLAIGTVAGGYGFALVAAFVSVGLFAATAVVLLP
jgi:hypothetical protein